MNLATISTAIATTFGTVTATNGSSTETATATALLPNQVNKVALLVYPPTGTLSLVMGGPRYDDQYDFPVKLLRDPVNIPDRSGWLYAWATALRGLIQTNIDLDVTGVPQAEVTAMRVELDGEHYATPLNTPGGDPLDVVELTVRVWVLELAPGAHI